MRDSPIREQHEHELTMHVFAISAGLVGVCLTAIGLVRILTAQANLVTMVDDLLSVDALLFMVCCNLAFWSFKTSRPRRRDVLRRITDILFMVALALMVAICALFAYTIA